MYIEMQRLQMKIGRTEELMARFERKLERALQKEGPHPKRDTGTKTNNALCGNHPESQLSN